MGFGCSKYISPQRIGSREGITDRLLMSPICSTHQGPQCREGESRQTNPLHVAYTASGIRVAERSHFISSMESESSYSVFSGEIHPFRWGSPLRSSNKFSQDSQARLLVPSLWLNLFQKPKAAGFNCVSFYTDWAYCTKDNLEFTKLHTFRPFAHWLFRAHYGFRQGSLYDFG
jgi:hypothetical protein